MSPFGFTPEGNPDEPEKNENQPDFAAMMHQMQEQMKAQFEQLGINTAGFVNPFASLLSATTNNEVLPKTTVREVAKKFVQTQGWMPLGTRDVDVTNTAFEIAEIWLNEATSFPATEVLARAITRADWVDETLPGWQDVMEPLAAGLAAAISNLLDQAMTSRAEGEEQQIPIEMISTLLRSFIGTMVATQLGQSIGTLAIDATGAHDVGLPLITPARPLLVPENIEKWSLDLELPKSEIFLFQALREGAVARLFAHNPWLVSYIKSTITEYGKGIHIDIEAIQRQAEEALNGQSLENFDPSSFSIELNQGIFTPEETPAQKIALSKLETVLALIDGWADEVTTLAAGDRLPSLDALREMHKRRRASSNPAEKLFSSMLGLQVSPKLIREASAFWSSVRGLKGVHERDLIWSGLLPTAQDLIDPAKFLTSTLIPDDLSGLI